MKTICFVTYELAPVTPGGCGTFITQVIPELAGHMRVLVLAGMSSAEVSEYRRRGLHDPRGTGVNEVFCLDEEATASTTNATNLYIRNSQRFADALGQLCERQRIDLLEIPEYAGMAYATIKLKRQHGWFADQRVAVRLHGSLELIDHHERSSECSLQRHMIYMMERYTLRHADTLIAPTEATFAEYQQFYGLDRNAIISPPPLARRPAFPRTTTGPIALCVGRVQAIKGVDLFVRAGLRWLEHGAPPELRFVVVGSDRIHEAFRSHVQQLIPSRARDRFEFVGHRSAEEIAHIAERARFAVVPSRWESFGYVPRELLTLGLPVIVSRIAAFRELEGTPGVTFFDGSVLELARIMVQHWQGAAPPQPGRSASPLACADTYLQLTDQNHGQEARAASDMRVRVLALEPLTVASDTFPPAVLEQMNGDRAACGLHRQLSVWLENIHADYVAVLLAGSTATMPVLEQAAMYLRSHPEITAVEFLPRYLAPDVIMDPQAALLALVEADSLTRGLFGLVPSGLVFRLPAITPELLPGSPQHVMRQLVGALAASGEVELMWLPGALRDVVVPAEESLDGGGAPLGDGASVRWALAYLRRRAAEGAASPTVQVVGPLYWARRSWQVLRNEGARVYVQKVMDTARRTLSRGSEQ